MKTLNIIGLILALPMLMVAGMSTDARADGQSLHWSHQFFIFANIALGPLCFMGLISEKTRKLGALSLALCAVGWILLFQFCDDKLCQ